MPRTGQMIYDEIESVQADLVGASADGTREMLEEQLFSLWDELDLSDALDAMPTEVLA